MIRIDGLAKRFGRLELLQGIDLTVGAGRVTAIIGPNGAGKTTLIKIILGLARPDAGVVRLNGQNMDDDPALRARIGYMPQIARFPRNLTARELIAMLRDLRDPSECSDDELVRRFGLERELDKPLHTLSGGNRQKINAVCAFLFDPDLVVLDEPTAGLDPVASGILKEKVRSGRDQGRSFILTTHIMSEVDELADDIVLLLDGRVRFAGAVHELKIRTRQLNIECAIAQLMLHAEAA
jgi:Cu-processing system ATP-binding protein